MRAKQDIISRSKKGCLSRGHSKMGNATSLSDDVLARAASFLYHKEQFLALRATSKRGLAVIRRAVEMKLAHFCRKLVFHGKFEGYDAMRQLKPQEFSETPLYVYLMGRLFGAGCMRLDAAGKSDQSISLIRSFVRQTRGGLRELNLWTARVSSDVLVELCAASPNLVRLTGPNCVHTSDEAIQAISAACPMLESVKFSQWGRAHNYSPAETYAQYFPSLQTVDLGADKHLYRPTRIAAIRQTALVTHATELKMGGCHLTPEVVDAIVGTPFGDRLESFGDFNHDSMTTIEPEAVLSAVRGFPNLVNLSLPEGTSLGGPEYYKLMSWHGNLRSLEIWEVPDLEQTCTDECIMALSKCSLLERLLLDGLRGLTSRVVDALLAGRMAGTLRDLTMWDCAAAWDVDDEDVWRGNFASVLRAADVLRLVEGCGNLSVLSWDKLESDQIREHVRRDPEPCRAIARVLVSRGSNRSTWHTLARGEELHSLMVR